MSKRQYTIISFLVLLIFFGPVIYYFVNSPRRISNGWIPNRRLCSEIPHGWKCDGTDFKNDCIEQKGNWLSRPNDVGDYVCILPTKDYGKQCFDSSECERACIVSRDYTNYHYPERRQYQNVICKPGKCDGKCAGNFDSIDFEIINGEIRDHTGIDF